jgi:hypothetical protein
MQRAGEAISKKISAENTVLFMIVLSEKSGNNERAQMNTATAREKVDGL